MKKLIQIVLFLIAMIILGIYAFSQEPSSCRERFYKNKCVACHSIESDSVFTNKPNDLSGIDTLRGRDFYVSYISKESELNGKKHPIKLVPREAAGDMIDYLFRIARKK